MDYPNGTITIMSGGGSGPSKSGFYMNGIAPKSGRGLMKEVKVAVSVFHRQLNDGKPFTVEDVVRFLKPRCSYNKITLNAVSQALITLARRNELTVIKRGGKRGMHLYKPYQEEVKSNATKKR